MPHRAGRNSSPEEFAKDLARRLAATPPPPDPGFSWRDSVVVGRLIYGGAAALFAVVLVGLVLSGVGWVMRGDGEIEPEVLSANIETSSIHAAETPSTITGDSAISDDVESFTTMPEELTPPPLPDNPSGVTPVTLPEATTTSTTGSGDTSTTSTTAATATSTSVATTQPPASSTSTIAPRQTTTTAATTTTPPTPTTTTPPTPTTTVPPSTTTTVEDTTTTTIEDTTTTTCVNHGKGRGNC